MKRSLFLNSLIMVSLFTLHSLSNCSETNTASASDTKKCFRFSAIVTAPYVLGALYLLARTIVPDTSHTYICDSYERTYDKPFICESIRGEHKKHCFFSDETAQYCPVAWQQIDAYEEQQRNLPQWRHEGPYARKQKTRNKNAANK